MWGWDFFKFNLRFRNSVHTQRDPARQKGVVGGRWGSQEWRILHCQGDLATGCGIIDVSIGEGPIVRSPHTL
jgi:hypothetical protein